MNKEIEKIPWASVSKTGMMLGGYTKTDNTITRRILYEYGPTELAVYNIILSHKNASENYSWPSINLIAKEVNKSRRMVITAINNLEKGNYLYISSFEDHVHSNRYYFPQESFFNPVDIEGLSRKSQKKKGPRNAIGTATEEKDDVGNTFAW